MLFLRLFSRRWLLATILVVVGMAVMVRLGIWQLDRLAQRRAFNARVVEQQDQPMLTLDASNVDADIYNMEYRQVTVSGHYLPDDEVVLRNQAWNGQLGVELYTPLLIEGTDKAILVERGWIPDDHADPAGRAVYRQDGLVTVQGLIRRAANDFNLGLRKDPTLAPGQDRMDAWINLDLDRIASQMDTPLLPAYVEILPEEPTNTPPVPQQLELDLSEGPHLGYAIQWFLFATVLGLGYPVYVRQQDRAPAAENQK